MDQLEGKTAIVTGAASGIGGGIARTLARNGMAVVLCDIRGDRLDASLAEVRGLGARAIAVVTDVSDRASVENAAREAQQAFGAIHVAANNAGVAMHGKPIAELSPAEWDWVIGVNIYGVIHGIQTFLPMIRAHGGEGHIVNTASIGGFQIHPGWNTGAYSMTKYAVVALSEALAQDLEGSPIGVSVLCPASVKTQLHASSESRPERLGGPYRRPENHFLEEATSEGLAPDDVGERVARAIRHRELFVFTHVEPREWVEERHARVQAAFTECEHWLAERAGAAAVRRVS